MTVTWWSHDCHMMVTCTYVTSEAKEIYCPKNKSPVSRFRHITFFNTLCFQCHLPFGTVSAAVPYTHPPDWGRVRHRVRQLQHEEVQRGPGSVQLVVLPEWPGPVCCVCVCALWV